MNTKFVKIIIYILFIIILFQLYINFKIPKSIGVNDDSFSPLKNSPNGVSTQAKSKNKYVTPLKFKDTKESSKKIIKKIISKQKGTKLIKETSNYLHFTFTSSFFHFKDDVEFYFNDKNKMIHFKSQSRIGYSDLGVNKKRYELIKKLYLSTKK